MILYVVKMRESYYNYLFCDYITIQENKICIEGNM